MKREKLFLYAGMIMTVLFAVWTYLLQIVDVRVAGETGMQVGFASVNCWFHRLTGVRLWLYHTTDWLGLIPLIVCFAFGGIGLKQMVKRRNPLKVDKDIILLGIYYIIVVACYLVFEMYPVNYRPIFIEGRLEASYPSSTTLLVLCVMPTLALQVKRRVKRQHLCAWVVAISMTFSVAMVIGRMISGVHWLTDIVGAVLLSTGLFWIYKGAVLLYCRDA